MVDGLISIEKQFLQRRALIENWFAAQWQKHQPPFYCSVDLRYAGYKLAPIDTNLFPAGFNNLSAASRPLLLQALKTAVANHRHDAKNILLLPERHTRNTFYLQNVHYLTSALQQAGFNTRIGSLMNETTKTSEIVLPDGEKILLEPLQKHQDQAKQGQRIGLDDFDPDLLLLNNDLSAGIPEILQTIIGQKIIPPLQAGWSTRRKSAHFLAYDQVVTEFSAICDLDSWLINPYFTSCSAIDFQAQEQTEALRESVATILQKTAAKYRKYQIHKKPYVVVKADAGTYGMGMMMVHDPDEVVMLNRRERNKMSVVKEGLVVNSVLVQEGVHSIEHIGSAVAEPVIYMVDRFLVGGFYRAHGKRNNNQNLNAPGMQLHPFTFNMDDDANPLVYAYGVIARLALLAAALELA